ncbi:unnamed protein product [Leuciscus chuanchicus]
MSQAGGEEALQANRHSLLFLSPSEELPRSTKRMDNKNKMNLKFIYLDWITTVEDRLGSPARRDFSINWQAEQVSMDSDRITAVEIRLSSLAQRDFSIDG